MGVKVVRQLSGPCFGILSPRPRHPPCSPKGIYEQSFLIFLTLKIMPKPRPRLGLVSRCKTLIIQYVCIHIDMCIYIYICIHIYIERERERECVCVCVIYIYIYIYIHIYIYRKREREGERERERGRSQL